MYFEGNDSVRAFAGPDLNLWKAVKKFPGEDAAAFRSPGTSDNLLVSRNRTLTVEIVIQREWRPSQIGIGRNPEAKFRLYKRKPTKRPNYESRACRTKQRPVTVRIHMQHSRRAHGMNVGMSHGRLYHNYKRLKQDLP